MLLKKKMALINLLTGWLQTFNLLKNRPKKHPISMRQSKAKCHKTCACKTFYNVKGSEAEGFRVQLQSQPCQWCDFLILSLPRSAHMWNGIDSWAGSELLCRNHRARVESRRHVVFIKGLWALIPQASLHRHPFHKHFHCKINWSRGNFAVKDKITGWQLGLTVGFQLVDSLVSYLHWHRALILSSHLSQPSWWPVQWWAGMVVLK